MNDKIAILVTQNKLKEAIQLLGVTESINLLGRLNALEQQERIGTISFSDANISRNRIVQAILSCAGVDSSSITAAKVAHPKTEGPEAILMTIVIQNKRRRPEIAQQADSLLSEVRAYEINKARQPSYDPVGRRHRALMEKIEKLQSDVIEAKGDSLESIVDKITNLLSETIPSYEKLREAYRLASGRGMSSGYIEATLNSQPDDDEARITIAEKIESFIATIQVS